MGFLMEDRCGSHLDGSPAGLWGPGWIHGSKSRYRSPTRTVLRRNGRGVSVAYRPIRKIK